jgi:hypothetical protein
MIKSVIGVICGDGMKRTMDVSQVGNRVSGNGEILANLAIFVDFLGSETQQGSSFSAKEGPSVNRSVVD